jgi:hypothetical protein
MAAKILQKVLYKELEPVIIDEKLIKQTVVDQFNAKYKYEALRLAKLVELDLSVVTKISLEMSSECKTVIN